MFIVGITGGIGSGKTAVSDRFGEKGIAVVDADICSRVVVEPGRPALAEIAKRFGEEILSSDGSLDRAKLREIIFHDGEAKQWLEALLHPLIGEELMNQLNAATSEYVVLASPLLVEAGQNLLCDKVLVVDVPEDLQIERTAKRDNNSVEQVKKIIASQASREQRLQSASDVIVNDQGLDHLDNEVARLHQQYLEQAREKAHAV
jgi:dephospho-CoA kinase